jgi:hypothetical protein
MKVLLGSGRLVTLFPEYGPDATIRAAEMTDAPAVMSFGDRQYYSIATVFVAVKAVQDVLQPEETDDAGKVTKEATYGPPRTQQDLAGDATDNRAILLAFRKAFSDAEWEQLAEAVTEAYKEPGKALKPFKLLK